MPDYAALAAELAKPAYAGLSDAAAATALNTPIVEPTGQRVPISEIQRVAFDRGKLLGILQAAQGGTPAAVAAAYLFSSAKFESVDITDPQFTGQVVALKTASLIDDGDIAAIQALATRTTSTAIRVFGVTVAAADVAHARSLT